MRWLTYVGIFPLLSVAFSLLAFFVGYAIAVSKNHVDAWLPFISDCGALPPESMIFGQLLNLGAIFLALTCFFLHIRNLSDFNNERSRTFEYVSLVLMLLGIGSCVGESMVANFQESNALATHDVGAFTFFIGITIYFWGLTCLQLVRKPPTLPMYIVVTRCILCILIAATLIFHMVCLFASPFIKGNYKVPDYPHNIARPKKGDKDYNNHLATTISEWCLALMMELFVLTFVFDLTISRLLSDEDEQSLRDAPKTFMVNGHNTDKVYYAHQVAPLVPPPSTIVEYSVSRDQNLREKNLPPEETSMRSERDDELVDRRLTVTTSHHNDYDRDYIRHRETVSTMPRGLPRIELSNNNRAGESTWQATGYRRDPLPRPYNYY